jgi:hypothetical protein
MLNIIVQVSKTENKARVKIGEQVVTIPTLEDFTAQLVAAKIKAGDEGKDEEGLPVYDNDVANWIMSAVVSAAKAAARNKLIPGTAELRPGVKIATNWEEFCAESDRGGNGAALQLLREVKEDFTKWVKTLGKNEATQNVMVTLFSSKAALKVATNDTKGKIKAYVEQFAESLSVEQAERYERPLTSVLETCDEDTSDF